MICCMVLLFAGCQNGDNGQNGHPDSSGSGTDQGPQEAKIFAEGVVVGKDDLASRILITERTGDSVRAAWLSVTTETQMTTSENEAISFTDIQVGHRLEAWHTGEMRESFPEQGTAAKIVLLPQTNVPSGWISEQQAVQTALASVTESEAIWTVEETALDEEGEQWTVSLAAAQETEEPRAVSVDAQSGRVIQMQNDAFRVFAPAKSETVGSSFTVEGKARVFEAAFMWELEDGHNILAQGQGMAAEGAPEWSDFTVRVSYDPNQVTNPHLNLILYVNSAKDGSREHELIYPLIPQENAQN